MYCSSVAKAFVVSKSVSWLSPKVSPRGQGKQGSHDDPKPQTLPVCWWPIHAKMVAQDIFLRSGFLFGCCLVPAHSNVVAAVKFVTVHSEHRRSNTRFFNEAAST